MLKPRSRLNSWKEVGAFFGKSESTVKRWEAARGLPIHRLPGDARSGVYAEVAELEDWLKSHRGGADEDASPDAVPRTLPGRWLAIAGAAMAAVIAIVVLPGLLRPDPDAPPPEARNLYLQGMKDWQSRQPDSIMRAADEFNAAIRIDPGYARAYAGLANCYNLMPEYTAMPVAQAFPQARAAAQHAVRLDDHVAAAHAALAFADFFGFADSVGAQREYKRALALDPDDANVEHWYATFLLTSGDYRGAMTHIDHALALNPDSISIQADRGIIQFHLDPVAAVAAETALEQRWPSFPSPHKYLADMYFMLGKDSDFIREERVKAQLTGDGSAAALADMEMAGLRASGHEGMLRAILAVRLDRFSHGATSAYSLATLYGQLGDSANAIKYLKLSFDRHEPEAIYSHGDTSFAAMSAMPSFREQVARLHPT